jgi:type IV secretory pathway VirB10-like protein
MPNRPDPQVMPAEAAVRLRAHPPSPKRLSRKVLMAGAGAIGLVIAFALVTGLSPRSEAASPRTQTAPPAEAALPEGLSRLPARYETGALTQSNAQLEEPYDRLWGPDGPPEHLDLDPEGYAEALSLPEGSEWATDASQQQGFTPPASPQRDLPPADLFFKRRDLAGAFSVNPQPLRGAGATNVNTPAQTYLTATPRPPAGPPYLIQSGSIIPAALLTAVNSDLPGRVIAQVSAPVYDSVTGDHLLIPQGARLIGTYASENSYGDTRVFLSWDRLLMPDGISLELTQMAATDAAGAAGLGAKVDNHLGRVGGAIAVSAVLSILANEAEDKDDQGFTRSLGDAAAQEAARTGSRIVDRELNLRPTLRVPAGAPVRVLITEDILLAPYTE